MDICQYCDNELDIFDNDEMCSECAHDVRMQVLVDQMMEMRKGY